MAVSALTIRGHAAVWHRPDRAGDVFVPGAFQGAGAVPLLWQHRGGPVGQIAMLGEDERGLRIEARVDDARVAAMVRAGALSGLSVGYRPLAVRRGRHRTLERVALIEVSLVAIPMQPLARISEFQSEEDI